MKILAFGDMQLGAHGRLADQAEVLGRIAGLAVEQQVDLVLDGGDTFEGPGIPPECLEVFAQFVRGLRLCEIPVLAISGNGRHDAAMRETNGLAIFDHIDGITVASRPDVYRFDGCMVAALPWVSTARLVASQGRDVSRDEIHAEAARLLVESAGRLHDDCRQVASQLPAVLLTHFSISGATLPTGLPVDQLREPVLPLAELEALGFDAIVASHIHRPQTLAAGQVQPEIPVFFTGSPMAHDFGEAGFEHGIWLLTLDGPHGATHAEFVPVASRPLVTIDGGDFTGYGDIPIEVSFTDGDRPDGAIVRVRYRATATQQRRIDIAAARRAILDAGAYSVTIQPEIVRADRARVAGLDEQADELAAFDQWTAAYEFDPEVAARMRAQLERYLEAAV